jgi:hypothetical protein
MTKPRLALFALVAVLVVLLAGYFWGASGRGVAEDRAGALEVQLRLTEAQRALATARVDLFELNYGQASRHMEDARRALERLAEVLDREGPREAREPVQQATAQTREAQQLVARMDQAAGSRAADALASLQRVETALPRAAAR